MFTNRYIRKFAKNTVTKCADILKFSAERSRIEQTLKSRDISPTEFWNQIPEKYRTKIFARLEQTMLEISRETKAQYPQNLLATVTGLCTYMDENAEQVIRKQISTN